MLYAEPYTYQIVTSGINLGNNMNIYLFLITVSDEVKDNDEDIHRMV